MENYYTFNDYYKNIGELNEKVNGQSIILTPSDIEKIELRIAELNDMIDEPDVWDDLVDKYHVDGHKINYTNCHNAIYIGSRSETEANLLRRLER